MHVDAAAAVGARSDCQRGPEDTRALLHTRQADAVDNKGGCFLHAATVVDDAEDEGATDRPQRDQDVVGATVA